MENREERKPEGKKDNNSMTKEVKDTK